VRGTPPQANHAPYLPSGPRSSSGAACRSHDDVGLDARVLSPFHRHRHQSSHAAHDSDESGVHRAPRFLAAWLGLLGFWLFNTWSISAGVTRLTRAGKMRCGADPSRVFHHGFVTVSSQSRYKGRRRTNKSSWILEFSHFHGRVRLSKV